MSETESNTVNSILEKVQRMTPAQIEKLGYICDGIALATETQTGKEESGDAADDRDDDAGESE